MSIETSIVPQVRKKEFLHEQYAVLGKSMGQIAREQGCSRSVVSHYLVEHEIPIRETRLSSTPAGQVAFGEKVRGGQVVPHLGEQAIIQELMILRGQGRSYGELVKWLKAKGIESKNGRPWARTTVLKILRRAAESRLGRPE